MLGTTLVAVAVLAAAPVAGGEERYWNDVVGLTDPDDFAAGEARLRLLKEGRAALPVLIRAARAAGDEQSLWSATRHQSCRFPVGRAWIDHSRSPGRSAAELVVELARGSPELLRVLIGFGDPVSVRLALAAATDHPERLPDLVEQVVKDADHKLLSWASSAMHCGERLLRGDRARYERLAKRLRKRLALLRKEERCETAAEAPRLLQGLLDGTSSFGGISYGTGGVWITGSNRTGGHHELSPSCALALYQAGANAGRPEPDLLIPLLRLGMVGNPETKQALALALRDLPTLGPRRRGELAAAAINAGGKVGDRIELGEPRRFAGASVLEAAARQSNPEAKREIARRALCGGSFAEKDTVLLLGFLDAQWAGDRAAHIAEVCEEERSWAVAALLFREDPRAIPFLGAALSTWMYGASETRRALREKWSPPLEAELRRLAANGHAQAREFLETRSRETP